MDIAPTKPDRPHLLSVIAEIGGDELADRFAAELGGRPVDIPVKPKLCHRVVAVLGLEVAEKLVETYGSGKVVVPTGRPVAYPKQARALELLRQGKTNTEVAREVGCHLRTVERARRKLRRQDQRDPAEGTGRAVAAVRAPRKQEAKGNRAKRPVERGTAGTGYAEEIRALKAKGLSVGSIVDNLGVTEAQVLQALRGDQGCSTLISSSVTV